MKIIKSVLLFSLICVMVLYADAISGELNVVITKDVLIPMRDGVKLAANISRPDDENKYPVILMRTPYGKDNEEDEFGEFITGMGYVLVILDCRGTSKSNGAWIPGIHEKNDGIDTREWILKQPWCNGNIDKDPQFIDDDLRPSVESPCIDIGKKGAIPEKIIKDLDLNPRINNGTVDLGAYESQR